jgi:hypothetical protein
VAPPDPTQRAIIVPARGVPEVCRLKWHQAALRLALLGGLRLVVLFPLTGLSATGYQPQATWRYTLNKGDSRQVKQISLNNNCPEPHVWSLQANGGFIRFDREVKRILVRPGVTELVGVILDAKRKESVYLGSVIVECLDCEAKETCQIINRSVFPVELTIVKPPPSAEERKVTAERTQTTFISKLAHLSLLLDERIQNLEVIEGDADGQRQKGYSVAQVGKLIAEMRKGLEGATKVAELRALGAYATKHYRPETYLVTIRVKTDEVAAQPESRPLFFPPSLHSRALRAPLTERLIVTIASAHAAFNSIRNLFTVLRDNSGRMTLKVISIPDGANIELVAPGGKKYTRSTNSDIEDFWAGTYRLRVTKEGFITIVHDNQDVGFGNTGIECQLVKAGEPILCRFN